MDTEKINQAFTKFKDLADKKKFVTDRDIGSLLSEKVIECPQSMKLLFPPIQWKLHHRHLYREA